MGDAYEAMEMTEGIRVHGDGDQHVSPARTVQLQSEGYRAALEAIAKIDCMCDGLEPECDTPPHIACAALGIPWPHPDGDQRRDARAATSGPHETTDDRGEA